LDPLNSLPDNFSFVWENRIAGSAHPGGGRDLVNHLAALREVGVGAILSLTEDALDLAPLREFEMEYLHLPIRDFTAPNPAQVDEAMDFLHRQVEQGHGALVHCLAGVGRTGAILACYLVSEGMAPKEAIDRIRRLRPHSLEVYSQEYCVFQLALRLEKHRQAGEG
jgi:atypical dual specificity phosphatase